MSKDSELEAWGSVNVSDILRVEVLDLISLRTTEADLGDVVQFF